jgi:hypothetical protein
VTPTEALLAVQRSKLSSRSRVLREANRRGKWFGIISRAGRPISSAEASLLAAESAEGRDAYGHCAVPSHWRSAFIRAFVKAAVFAAHTERNVSARSL